MWPRTVFSAQVGKSLERQLHMRERQTWIKTHLQGFGDAAFKVTHKQRARILEVDFLPTFEDHNTVGLLFPHRLCSALMQVEMIKQDAISTPIWFSVEVYHLINKKKASDFQ